MSDEQRMREQFDAFVYERTVNRNMSGPWPTPTELAWLAWQARDAEVQALREALEELVSIVEIDQRYREQAWAFAELDMARAALAGGETGGESE